MGLACFADPSRRPPRADSLGMTKKDVWKFEIIFL